MKKQNKICKILEVLGILILIFSFICNQLELIPFILIIVIALIGLLLCIPENVIFYKAQMKKEEEKAGFRATALGEGVASNEVRARGRHSPSIQIDLNIGALRKLREIVI